jgi:hypothetical protein
MDKSGQHIDYKTHILNDVRPDGIMSIIDVWAHVPPQAEVERVMDATSGPYVTFALCTPTSVMPAKRTIWPVRAAPSRFGTSTPGKRR